MGRVFCVFWTLEIVFLTHVFPFLSNPSALAIVFLHKGCRYCVGTTHAQLYEQL